MVTISLVVQQVQPGRSKEGEDERYLVVFQKKIGVEHGIKEKATGLENIKGETLLETGYCKKECTEENERVEGGQKKEIG